MKRNTLYSGRHSVPPSLSFSSVMEYISILVVLLVCLCCISCADGEAVKNPVGHRHSVNSQKQFSTNGINQGGTPTNQYDEVKYDYIAQARRDAEIINKNNNKRKGRHTQKNERKAEVDVNKPDPSTGMLPLLSLTLRSDIVMVRHLILRKGAHADIRGKNGNTALMLASRCVYMHLRWSEYIYNIYVRTSLCMAQHFILSVRSASSHTHSHTYIYVDVYVSFSYQPW